MSISPHPLAARPTKQEQRIQALAAGTREDDLIAALAYAWDVSEHGLRNRLCAYRLQLQLEKVERGERP
jgi:hypothetical protein